MVEIISDVHYQFNNKNLTNVHICREQIMTMPVVIYMKKNSYLVNAVNDKIGTLRAAGLIDYWYTLSFTDNFHKNQVKPRKVLTWNHLSGCFEIWGCGCLLSCVALLGEFIVLRWTKKKSRWKHAGWQRQSIFSIKAFNLIRRKTTSNSLKPPSSTS
ncbi:hypothetical protein ACKWTF_010220 [Chironomus riparius]